MSNLIMAHVQSNGDVNGVKSELIAIDQLPLSEFVKTVNQQLEIHNVSMSIEFGWSKEFNQPVVNGFITLMELNEYQKTERVIPTAHVVEPESMN